MISYIKSRLKERSTLVGIGTAVAAASALPGPWNWISLAVGTLAALVPDGKVAE
jgi:hypothetical protein